MEFNDFKYVGYVTFYVALFSEKLGTIVKYESDFRTPITEEFIQGLIKHFIQFYDEKYGMKVTQVQFVSKDVYEAYCDAYSNSLDTTVEWKDDRVYINGKLVKE